MLTRFLVLRFLPYAPLPDCETLAVACDTHSKNYAHCVYERARISFEVVVSQD